MNSKYSVPTDKAGTARCQDLPPAASGARLRSYDGPCPAQLLRRPVVSTAVRRIAPSALLMLVLLVLPASTGAAAARKGVVAVCPRAHSRVVLADSQAEVFLAPEDPALPEFLGFYGCSFKGKRSYLLGTPPAYSSSGGSGIRLETLAGSIVAYEGGSASSHYGTSWLVIVRDLRTGKVLHSVPTGTPAHPEPPRTEDGITGQDVGIGPAAAIVVKSDGAVAWIVEAPNQGSGANYEYQVHAVDSTGSRVLAAGPEVEPRSLALAGSTLYWMVGGKPMSATLN